MNVVPLQFAPCHWRVDIYVWLAILKPSSVQAFGKVLPEAHILAAIIRDSIVSDIPD